jgi:hypothetical protein
MQWQASAPPTAKTLTVGVAKDKRVDIAYFPKGQTRVEKANGTRNVRYFERSAAVVGGRWFTVGFYGLATSAWTGESWEALVDEPRGEAMFAQEDARVDAIATDGARAWAVATSGAVFLWNGAVWETLLSTGGALFEKQRRFVRLAWDGAGERLVLWGGDNGSRSSNDTLLFERGAWRKSGKPGTKLASRKLDNYWVYDDTARRGIVRVGPDGCHLLEGDAWKPLDLAAPSFVGGAGGNLIIAHDPASRRTLWLDPLTGALHPEGGATPIANVGLPPGLVSAKVLQEAGAYFGADYERVNGDGWLWGWDPSRRRAYGALLGSSKYVCTLDLSDAFR